MSTTLPTCRDTTQALALFDRLEPVTIEFMLGAWTGDGFPSHHPLDGALAAYGWRGKRFDSAEHVHPLLFGGAAGEFAVRPRGLWPGIPLLLKFAALKAAPLAAVARALLPLLATRHSHARLRMLQFRGRVGAAIVYDDVPIIDVLRRIDDDTVLGLMDAKGVAAPFFFLLRRR